MTRLPDSTSDASHDEPSGDVAADGGYIAKVIYSLTLHRYEMWDGDYERDFEPSTTAPNEDQVFGETQNYNDQMPGGTGAHVTFTSTAEQHSGSTTWYSVSAPVRFKAPYGGSHPSTGRYEIWDTGCGA